MSERDTQDVAAIAAGLTKAQRACLMRLSSGEWREAWELAMLHYQRPANTATSLTFKGLAERRYHTEQRATEYLLTPRGLAVRAHILGETK